MWKNFQNYEMERPQNRKEVTADERCRDVGEGQVEGPLWCPLMLSERPIGHQTDRTACRTLPCM